MRRVTPGMRLAAAVLLLAGCAPSGGGASGEATDDDAVSVEVAETEAGPSLVGPDGRTLYVFTQDTDGASTCYDDCAEAWPPFEVAGGATVAAGDGVTGELGVTERDDGASQVTYDDMPLYFYAADAEPGDASGEGVGDVWFIASPEGRSGGAPSETAEPSEEGDDDDEEEAEPTQSSDYDY